jgi:hypothetical protein
VIVSYLPDPEQHPLWEGIKELLRPAVTDGEILDPGELVWIAIDGTTIIGAGTTAQIDDTTAAILTVGGTRHRDWIEQAEAAVSAWAQSNGATKLTMRGRKGWARYFRAFGWAVTGTENGQTVYEKELSRAERLTAQDARCGQEESQ